MNLGAPIHWRLRRLWQTFRYPVVIGLAILAWIYVPQMEARHLQNDLATEFFAECRKTLKDTDSIPKEPDEALDVAIHRRPVTNATLQAWAPTVSSEIRGGEWVARIQFSQPNGYVVEQTIGPALVESGYDGPSATQ